MKVNGEPPPARRTQAERTAATRARLLAAGRKLFASDGFAAVSTQTIVDAAGVTRGALYHQFGDKTGLFAAVYEDVERDLVTTITTRIVRAAPTDQLSAMRIGARLFLEECSAPTVQRIVLIDAPAVLGWDRWREVGMKYGLGVVEAMLARRWPTRSFRSNRSAPRRTSCWALSTRRRSSSPAPTTPGTLSSRCTGSAIASSAASRAGSARPSYGRHNEGPSRSRRPARPGSGPP